MGCSPEHVSFKASKALAVSSHYASTASESWAVAHNMPPWQHLSPGCKPTTCLLRDIRAPSSKLTICLLHDIWALDYSPEHASFKAPKPLAVSSHYASFMASEPEAVVHNMGWCFSSLFRKTLELAEQIQTLEAGGTIPPADSGLSQVQTHHPNPTEVWGVRIPLSASERLSLCVPSHVVVQLNDAPAIWGLQLPCEQAPSHGPAPRPPAGWTPTHTCLVCSPRLEVLRYNVVSPTSWVPSLTPYAPCHPDLPGNLRWLLNVHVPSRCPENRASVNGQIHRTGRKDKCVDWLVRNPGNKCWPLWHLGRAVGQGGLVLGVAIWATRIIVCELFKGWRKGGCSGCTVGKGPADVQGGAQSSAWMHLGLRTRKATGWTPH